MCRESVGVKMAALLLIASVSIGLAFGGLWLLGGGWHESSDLATGNESGTGSLYPLLDAVAHMPPVVTPTATPLTKCLPAWIDPSVPAGAVRVSSQADIDDLPGGSNAVLTADLYRLTLSRPINLFGAGHKVGDTSISGSGVRLSGAVATSVAVSGDDVTLDHNTVDSNAFNAISADRVSGLRVLSNTVTGEKVTDCTGIYVTNSTAPVVDGNTLTGAYYNIYLIGDTMPQVTFNHVEQATDFRQGIDTLLWSTDGGTYANNVIDYSPYHGSGSTADHDGAGFYYVSDLLIQNNTISGHYYTLKIYYSHNVTVADNTLLDGGVVLRVGFYSSDVTCLDNKISGDPSVGLSAGLYVHDDTTNCTFRGNEIWDCQLGYEEFHYPAGMKYLDGGPSLPCGNLTLEDNYIHDCSQSAIAIEDTDSTTIKDNTIRNCEKDYMSIGTVT